MTKLDKIKARFRKLKVYFLFLFSAVAITFMFPQEGKFRYEFQKGKPWMHETLVAPFDFPIYKPDNLIQAQRDSMLEDFEPYLRMDTLILSESLNVFKEKSFPEARRKYISELRDNLDDIYGRGNIQVDSLLYLYQIGIREILIELYSLGVMDDPVQLTRFREQGRSINIVTNQVVEERNPDEVFTRKTAYQYFTSRLKKLALQLQPEVSPSLRFSTFFDPLGLLDSNLKYDEVTTKRMMETFIAELSLTEGMIQSGEKIIGIGEPVNEEDFQIIQSLKKEYETNPNVQRNHSIIFVGRFVLVSLAFGVLYLFLWYYRKEILESGTKTFFILMLILIVTFFSSLTIKSDTLNVYVIPFVILPIIIKTFFDARIALFAHLVAILLIGFWAPNGFEFIYMNFIAGIIAIFTLKNLYRRRVLFVAALFTLLSYSLIYTGISIIQEGRFQSIDVLNYAWFSGNALMVLASYPLIYIFEKLFGFISDSTLVELSDTNQPLLRKLAENAPGTFQHSMQVASLSEEAALAVGANPLLIRTGALYHDIGKLENPMFYIENLTSNYNPHDNLEFSESARKIISHVTKGVELGRKFNIPEIIIDFIRTHHGTSTVQYFYRSYLKKYPEAEVDVAMFSYPGPKPYSKETAILMMADSVEAASRSLKTINKEAIRELVERIIDYQFTENQFEFVDLTLKDINTVKDIFRKRLINIYHARVEYPK